MNWTTDKPTKPGWYWWRNLKDGMQPSMTLVDKDKGGLYAGGSYVSFIGGEWAGPLEPPKES
jgi:hypothetical protein